MFLRHAVVIAVFGFAQGAAAQTAPTEARALWSLLGQPEIIAIMREEGLTYGAEIATDMFADRANADWTAMVSDIYDANRIETKAIAAFEMALANTNITAITAFFETPLGREIIQLETSARRAMLDDAVDEAAREAAAIALADDTPRHQQITRFIDSNDLIESNVVGAMNANYAFYLGLMEGGALPGELDQTQILTDVWSQEGDIRNSTGEWVVSFLTLAYQPLTEEELDQYIAFTETPAGQTMNRALFAAYDQVFVDISRALGLGAALSMSGASL